MCPVAQTSEIILAGEEPDLLQLVSGSPSSSSGDGFRVWEYDRSLAGKNLDFRWINESTFIPRKHKYLPMYRLGKLNRLCSHSYRSESRHLFESSYWNRAARRRFGNDYSE